MSEFSKIMADAAELSKIMEEFSSDKTPSTENPMFSNLSNIMNLMDIMKSFQNTGRPAPAPPAEVFENSHLPKNIMALKAMGPYMGEENRKNIIIAAKLMELMHFVQTMENQASCEGLKQPIDNRGLLIAARPYVDTDKLDMVDLLITVMDISEILGKMERMNQINAAKF